MSHAFKQVSTTSTGLLIGLGLRITLDKLLNAEAQTHPSTFHKYNLLLGAWQGVLLFQTLVSTPYYLAGVSAGVVLRFLVDLFVFKDAIHSIRSAIGLVLGFLLSGICALLWSADTEDFFLDFRHTTSRSRTILRRARKSKRHTQTPATKLDAISEEGSDLSTLAREQHRAFRNSEAHHQVLSLRSQAAAAAGDKRRCQEERKWAVSQGNLARASQLGWQIRKYEALRNSFEREARNKALELKQDIMRLRVPRHIPQPPSHHEKSNSFEEMDEGMEVFRRPDEIDQRSVISRAYSAPPGIEIEYPTSSEANENEIPVGSVHLEEEMPQEEVTGEEAPKEEEQMYTIKPVPFRSSHNTPHTTPSQLDNPHLYDPHNAYQRFPSTRSILNTQHTVKEAIKSENGLIHFVDHIIKEPSQRQGAEQPRLQHDYQPMLLAENSNSPVLLVTTAYGVVSP